MGKTIAIILIIAGLAMLIWTGFSFTREETLVEIGSVELTTDQQESVNWSPYVGGVVLVAGIVLLVVGRRR